MDRLYVFHIAYIHREFIADPYHIAGQLMSWRVGRNESMNDRTVQIALIVLGIVGALSVICIAVLIAVLNTPDVAALAVLSSIASAAVGGIAGMVTTHRNDQDSRTPDEQRRTPDTGKGS